MFLTSERLEEITAPLRDFRGTEDEYQNTFDKILESVSDWVEKAQICNYLLSAHFRRAVINGLQEKLDAAVKKREETVTVSIVELAEVLNMVDNMV